MVFIINNLDPNDTTSGPPGSVKIDNIRLVGCNPVDSSPVSQEVKEGASASVFTYNGGYLHKERPYSRHRGHSSTAQENLRSKISNPFFTESYYSMVS
jgi:hypothetical protein